MLSRKIFVTFKRVGFHCYPDAPEEVLYLRDRHRHLFGFRVEISVTHNEREIEFHMFQSFVTSLYVLGGLELNGKSCETIADELLNAVNAKYPGRVITVTVDEDGECGSVVSNV